MDPKKYMQGAQKELAVGETCGTKSHSAQCQGEANASRLIQAPPTPYLQPGSA